MTRAGESLWEASALTILLTNKIKTWNIRSAQVCREMKRYNLKILDLNETRWTGSGRTQLLSGDTIIYSGQNEGQPHTHGVPLLITPEATRVLLSWEPMLPRTITAGFNLKGRKVTIIQCYAPPNVAAIEEKDEFYQQIQAAIDKTPKKDRKIFMGDTNAKVSADNINS